MGGSMNITMVISTYKRADLLAHSLERLKKLTLPEEIIVVDDGGFDDETREVVRAFREWSGIDCFTLVHDNPGQSICSTARNIGVRWAKNDWVLTTEPELVFCTDIVARWERLHEDQPNDVISTGGVHFAPEGWVPSDNPEFLGLDTEYPDSWQDARGWVAPHAALWNKEWLGEVRGWDETFPGSWGWDDTDLLTRLRMIGHGQFIDLGAEAIHLFHPLGGDEHSCNEAHFLAKDFHTGGVRDIVANREHEWGMLKVKGQNE